MHGEKKNDVERVLLVLTKHSFHSVVTKFEKEKIIIIKLPLATPDRFLFGSFPLDKKINP